MRRGDSFRFAQMEVFHAEPEGEFGIPILIRYDQRHEKRVLGLFPEAHLELAAQAFLFGKGHDPLSFVKVRLKFDRNFTIRTRSVALRRIDGPGAADDDVWCALRYGTDRTWMVYFMDLTFVGGSDVEMSVRRFDGGKDELHVFANDVEEARRRRSG